ncbi:MAG: FAD-binding protein [bacterium]
MNREISRRSFLQNTLVGAVVVGFDILSGSWLTTRDLSSAALPARHFPRFDGILCTDDASLAAAADDYGHIVHKWPRAVLRPGSVDDIRKMIRFACKHKIKVAIRGSGYSVQGETQIKSGVVIEMKSLNQILEINPHSVLVEGGVIWSDLLERIVQYRLRPATLTNYLGLSVGGTISVGGVDGHAFRYGSQADNVCELHVVTGRGDLITSSPKRNEDLFNACRGGLGQFGVIVRARLSLIHALPSALVYSLPYTDLSDFMADQELLIDDGRFDYIQGKVVLDDQGKWIFLLEAAKYFSSFDKPDSEALLAGLSFIPGGQTIEDMSYFDFSNRLAPLVEQAKDKGVWDLPHPWATFFLSAADAYVLIKEILGRLTPDEVGPMPILIYPLNRFHFKAPFLCIPKSRHFFAFFILRTAIPPTLDTVFRMVASNRSLYEQVVNDGGGKRYPIDYIPMNRNDWYRHFQSKWKHFIGMKRYFDPFGIFNGRCGLNSPHCDDCEYLTDSP